MLTLILRRTHILENHTKGYLIIEGSKFSCYTLECRDPRLAQTSNLQHRYALPEGEYELKLDSYNARPFIFFVKEKKYKFFKPYIGYENENMGARPGCITIGSKFLGEKMLPSDDKVYDALQKIILDNFADIKKNGAVLRIEYDDECVSVSNGTYEEDETDEDDEINFIGL